MIALTQATDNATNQQQPADKRRITEQDADYQRLHAHFARLLRASLKLLLKELRAGDGAATARFIHRHTDLMRTAYTQAHVEGQRDYWHGVTHNLRRKHVVTPLVPDDQQVQRQLAFYALASVTKMAHEVQTHVRTTQTALSATTARLSGILEQTIQLDDAPVSDSDFLASLDNRVQLQGQIVWPGMQDGYVAAGANDSANPYSELWWNLEPTKTGHCSDCPQVAFGSPYDPPGSGGNELNQTPGDGRTECGAACKCDLSYSFPAEGSPALDQLAQAIVDQWNSWTAAGAPADAQPPQAFIPPAQTAQGDSTLSTQQISTMDAFRAAWDRWEAVRGDLPPAPTMFGTEWNGPDLPPWDSLTPEQQQVIADMQQALLDWMDDASNAFGFQPADSSVEEDSGQ